MSWFRRLHRHDGISTFDPGVCVTAWPTWLRLWQRTLHDDAKVTGYSTVFLLLCGHPHRLRYKCASPPAQEKNTIGANIPHSRLLAVATGLTIFSLVVMSKVSSHKNVQSNRIYVFVGTAGLPHVQARQCSSTPSLQNGCDPKMQPFWTCLFNCAAHANDVIT